MCLKKLAAMPLIAVSVAAIANPQANVVENLLKPQPLALNLPDLGDPPAEPAEVKPVTPGPASTTRVGQAAFATPGTLQVNPLTGAPEMVQRGGISPQTFSVPVQFGERWSTSLGTTSGGAQYNGSTARFDASLGLGHQSAQGSGVLVDGATMVGPYCALGANLDLSSRYSELVLSSIAAIPQTPWRVRGSLSYAKGSQEVAFYSGSDALKVSQTAGILTGQYVNPSANSLGWQSTEMSVWGAQAHNRNAALSPVSTTVDNGAQWAIITDRRLVSEGRMLGFSVGGQYAFRDNLVVNASLGYERVVYPFADGSSEHDDRPYVDAEVSYQATQQILLRSAIKSDATQLRFDIGAEYGPLGLKLFTARGLNGLPGDKGIMLTLNVRDALGNHGRAAESTLAERMKPNGDGGTSSLLASAVQRPTQLPETFLIKADPTAVTDIAVSKAGLANGSQVNPKTGDITFQVGVGPVVINSVTRNEAPFAGHGQITVADNTVTIHTSQMPVPSATDVYAISLTDATGALYSASVTGVRGAAP
jgi:hypothetical protein